MPELGYHEEKSSALLQQHLQEAGFRVEAGVADEPTGFIASYGQGKPVIAILGEFDALPGLSQAALPDRSPLTEAGPGHGCGHNLLGSGAALAAVAVKEYMETNHVAGTLRYYGTPAEEGGDGKVYMVRAGLFRDVDVVLHWHPGDRERRHQRRRAGHHLAPSSRSTASRRMRPLAPERGRSALDAVMLMGNGVEFMREHIPSNSAHPLHHHATAAWRPISYRTPPRCSCTRAARRSTRLDGIWGRILKIAQGAALMTETTLDVKDARQRQQHHCRTMRSPRWRKGTWRRSAAFSYTAEEKHFAEELQKSLPPGSAAELDSTTSVEPLRPFDPNQPGASTDVGDVSWNVPTIGFVAATFVPGVVAAHLAGGRVRRHEHRPEGHGGSGQGAGRHRRGSVRESEPGRRSQEGFHARWRARRTSPRSRRVRSRRSIIDFEGLPPTILCPEGG